MAKVDLFTARRITALIQKHRAANGTLPTLKDFEAAGIERGLIDQAVRHGLIELFYVTLSNGTVVKGYKIRV